MRTFSLIFMMIMLFTIIKGFREIQKDLEKTAEELKIPENHPMRKTLQEFIFFNHFRFWMLLFVVFYTGLMLYITLV